MAQRITTLLIDDLDGETEATETVAFGLDGASYEIDLSDVHAEEFRDAVATFVGAARRPGGRATGATEAKRRPAAEPKTAGEPGLGAVRTWAQEQGLQVASRGRVSAKVLQAYQDAH